VTLGPYDETSARRYARIESRPDSFSLRLAPRIRRLFDGCHSQSSDAPRMLDIGCGTGQLADYFRAAGFVTIGVDRSTAMLRHRVDDQSDQPGPVAAADATDLPLGGRFDLITATFNVFNHLPDQTAVASVLGEVARLLVPTGLCVFDINTELGLRQVSELTEIGDGSTERIVWCRRWVGDRLALDARGSFLDGGVWHAYEERIEKIVIHTEQFDAWCAAVGLSRPSWRSDDLSTPRPDPEESPVAFGVIRGTASRD
jgi:SAM-dependent methyltransferase